VNLQDLRKSPLFVGLSDDELQHLMDNAKPVSLHAGDVLMKQGDPGNTAFVIVSGELEVTKQSGQSVIRIDVRNPGDVLGEMALLSQAPRSATITAVTDCETLCISKEVFDNLLSTSPSAAKAILHWTMARLSQNDALLHQQERMAALGTLSAGLAHELNNPAAAAQRSAAELDKSLLRLQILTHQIESRAFREGQMEWLDSFMQDTPRKLDALEKIDLVDQLQAWLEANDIESAWEFAPAMVNFGWNIEELEKLKESTFFGLLIQWVGVESMTLGLLSEVQQATGRVSQIVQAMKSYTYLDQAPLLEVDVHEGLENTLIIMQHKL